MTFPVSLESSRLLMRPFTLTDSLSKMPWFFDPNVMDKTFGGVDNNESLNKRINRYVEHNNLHGFSKWLVIHKKTGEYIGDAGLYCIDNASDSLDIGFRLNSSYWNQGLGSEIVRSWFQFLKNLPHITSVVATVFPDNIASEKLLAKHCFKFDGYTTQYSTAVKRFRIDRPFPSH